MGIWKAIFGGKDLTAEEEQQERVEKNFDLLKYDGVKAMKMGQADYAVKCFNEALKLKDDLEVRDYLSQTLIRQGEFDEATRQLELMASAEPDNQDILLQLANVAYMAEDYERLAEVCERAMAVRQDNETVCLFAARACVGKGEKDDALVLLDKAVALRDDYADARLQRGMLLLEEQRVEEADADANWLMDYAGTHEDVIMFKAQIEKAKGNADEACRLYGMVIEQNPFSTVAYRSRADLYRSMGRETEAENDMAQAKEIDPSQDVEDIEQQVKQAYKNSSPFGV